MTIICQHGYGCPDIASGLEAKRWLPEHCFAPCFVALSYPCTIHLCSVLKLATGLEHENWPERGLAAVPTTSRVPIEALRWVAPKKCSKARLAKSSLRQQNNTMDVSWNQPAGYVDRKLFSAKYIYFRPTDRELIVKDKT